MTFEATLARDQFIRLSILRHIQRKSFYFYAATGAALTAYGLVRGPAVLALVAWIPFIFYLLPQVVAVFRQSKVEDHPLFLPAKYEFTKRGVSIKNDHDESQLTWEHFASWKIMAQCYVLVLTTGPMLAIPQSAVPTHRRSELEALLGKYIA